MTSKIKIKKIQKSITTNRKIVFCCFETITFEKKHYIICFSLVAPFIPLEKSLTIEFSDEQSIEEKSSKLISEFLVIIEELVRLNVNATIAFHDLYHFTGYLIIAHAIKMKLNVEIISKTTIIYKFYILIQKTKIEFRNTNLLTEMDLNDLCLTFLDKKRKSRSSVQISCLTPEKLISIQYFCLEDTRIFCEAFNSFLTLMYIDFNIDAYQKLTIAALSLKIFKTNFYDKRKTPIVSPCEDVEACIRTSYLGGVVEVYKPQLKNGYHYDVNSLYPYVMSKYNFPVGNGIFINCTNTFCINNFFGFVYVEVTSPKDLDIPFLACKHVDKGLISPIGRWTSFYFSEEIKEAIKLGYNFKFIYGIRYKKAKPFKNFVNSIYTKRIKNSKLNKFYKKILNSLYGRFGMKQNKNITKIVSHVDTIKISKIFPIESLLKIAEDKFIVSYNPEENLNQKSCSNNQQIQRSNSLKSFTAVQIASAITAYARIVMYKYKKLDDIGVYYSDTDSIFCDTKINPKYVSNNKIGKLKLVNEVKFGLFITPKAYFISDQNNVEIAKIKGIGNYINMKTDLVSLFEGKSIILPKIYRIFRDVNTFEIKNLQIQIQITGKLLKRDKIFNVEGIWINTKPIFYDEKTFNL